MKHSLEVGTIGRAILDLVEGGNTEPAAVLEALRARYSEDEIKEAISALIDHNDLVFTRDWRFRVNPNAYA